MSENKVNKCPVCGETMSLFLPYCPKCSFEVHILPDNTPVNIRKIEEERVRVAKKAYDHQVCIDSDNKKLTEINKKLNEDKSNLINDMGVLEDRIVSMEGAMTEKEKKISDLNNQTGKINKELKDVNKKLKDKEEAYNSLKKDFEIKKSEFAKKEEEYKKAMNLLANDSKKNEKTVEKKNSTCNHPPKTGKEIGKVTFILGGRSESVPIFGGPYQVTAPQWTNIKGVLFEINGDKGIYRILDLKGCICDRHGKMIPTQGATTRNNEVFKVGDLTIRFTLPEIDFEDLY